jgi:putative peptidoglycan lipid II flippase
MLSRITGLVRERIMAGLFGASMAYDAFLLGFRIPNLTRDLFAEGALSSAFVPTFTEYLATKSKKEANDLANLVATALLVVVGSLCMLGILLSPWLVRLLAPGFLDVPGKYDVAVRMTRIMFPFLLLVALAAQANGILNACHSFFIPALASMFFNVTSVAAGLALGFWLGPHIGMTVLEGMAWGVVIGGLAQWLGQAPLLLRHGFTFRLRLQWNHPGLRHILSLMGPAILGNAAVQVNVMVNTYFASLITDPVRGQDGPVSWLSYAFRFMQLPLGLFGQAIGSATLPAITRSAVAGKMDEFRKTLSHSLGMVFLLTLPSSVGLVVLGQPMIGAIYQTGKFDAYDTRQTATALACYAIGLAGYSALKVIVPAFYTLHDARTPMVVSLLSVFVNFSVSWFVTRHSSIGHSGLALSTSVVALFNFLVLFVILRNRIGGVYGRALFATFAKVTLASALMGSAVYVVSGEIQSALGTGLKARIVDLGLSIALGLALFYFLCRLFRVAELGLAASALGPLRRLMRRQA